MAQPRPQLSLNLRGEQHMLLLPQLLQSIELLQLPAHELDTYLRAAVEENEALRLSEAPRRAAGGREAALAHDEFLQSRPARPRSIAEIVREQLATAEIEDELWPWVSLLVEHLDSSGYVSASDEELLAQAEQRGFVGDAGWLGRAFGVLQSLEPRGIGARNAIEALLLQLEPSDPDYQALCRLLEEFLGELAKNRLPRVAQAMGVEIPELQRLLEILRGLNPRPLSELSEELAPVVEPELVIEVTEEGQLLRLCRSTLDDVAIDPAVRELAADKRQPPEVRRYLRGRLERASWLVRAVEQRQSTLLAVAGAVFARQTAFLQDGPGHLVPLRMGEIAEELGLSTSTVSRAVAGKHVQTPWGVFPLRQFFPAPAAGEAGLARDDLRERVRALITAEDEHAPLSDDELCAILAGEGHSLARRTVAKYRKELGIQSSYLRRRF